eukprot:Blabericola_migrator_1__269@NODE_106_length_14174_cov_318_190118_g94_i0_p2_GENE_NODE_106_length_14174_cov_318_190118_g94_i0NODE_106_length_14174_cov_318_190118_g94_i0_p2_ORF_typecomplete_len671_score135_90HOOK/PF05622_12/0_11HOOK/PF05622_12/0_016MscS_porin/PF12795_7/34MscS_porin/PF12795_7/0_00067DUF3450/PF11932_8/1_4e02DUF3450/PF11932_8/1_6e03DUF3450/PF11932_8/5_5DUF3450/PF11932_8/0_0042DUF3450/PF11932_8/85Fez1/PF06818_15/9_7e02Fez1/PF06818_15/0_37Fez1/PF06818_15/0_025Rab5bind/PF09311_11/2_8e02R
MSKLGKLTHGVTGAIQKASSVITTSLKSCDDTSDVISNTNEIYVGPKKQTPWGQELLSHQQQLSTQLAHSTAIEPRVWGDYTFHVNMQWQGRTRTSNGTSDTDFGGVVCINAWSDATGAKRELPVKIKWRRKCAGLTFQTNFSGSKFPVTADDVGCSILAEVTPSTRDMGTAYCEIGPFDLDASMGATLQGYIAANGTTFSVTLVSLGETLNDSILDSEDKTLVLYINNSELRLTRPGPNNVGFLRNWSAPLTAHQNIVSVDILNPCGFTLHFEDTESANSPRPRPVKVAALSRRQRDTIVLTIRAFQAQQLVVSSILLEQVAINTNSKLFGHLATDSSEQVQSPSNYHQASTQLDFYLIFAQLNRQLVDLLEMSNRAQRDKARAIAERDALEKDIDSTIEIYKQLLNEQKVAVAPSPKSGDDSSSDGLSALLGGRENITQRAALMADLQMQLKEAQQQAQKYLDDLESLRRDHNVLKIKLQEKEQQLKAWLEAPTQNMTTDFDEQKASLRERIEDLLHQKNEAESNFHYMKKRYEELETRQKQISHSYVEATESLERREKSSKREIEQFKEKTMELESLLRKRDDEILRLQNEISRTQRDKTNLEKSLDRSRREISDYTKRLADLNPTFLMNNTTMATQMGIDQKDREIEKLKAENETLKRKLRDALQA